MIVVFPGNKLISTDSIVPILLELYLEYGIVSRVVTFDQKTFDGINKNVVIRDSINEFGKLVYIKKNLPSYFYLLFLYLKGFFGAKYIHFGILSHGIMLRLWSFHSKNIFYSQQDSFKNSVRNHRKIIFNKKPKEITHLGNNVIAFHVFWPQLEYLKKQQKKIFLFGETRTRKAWVDRIYKNKKRYFDTYHPSVKKNKVIVYILGPFCEVMWLREKDSFVKLFKKTILILNNKFPDTKVLIKPHITTDMKLVNKAIKGKEQFEITYLHPGMLSTKAMCFISNLASTTFADANSFGVPTVEFTDYSKPVLNETGMHSLNPYTSHFINNDLDVFYSCISSIVNSLDNNNILIGNAKDDSGLIMTLS
jgi:hypothetical protein